MNLRPNQCHNPGCSSKRRDPSLSCCEACRSALYCSTECQSAHYPIHQDYCRTSLWSKLGADYTTKDGGSSNSNNNDNTNTNIFKTVLYKFDEPGTLINNEYMTDFFASLRVNLKAIMDTAVGLKDGNGEELEKMLDLWSSSRSSSSSNRNQGNSSDSEDDYIDQSTTTSTPTNNTRRKPIDRVEQWKRVTSREHHEKTKTDKEIEVMLEKEKIYTTLIDHCKQHLGVKRSQIKGTRQVVIDGIYLNMNWDDEKQVTLPWNTTSVVGSGILKAGFDIVTRAREEWIEALGETLWEIDAMVGLKEIKENVGRFILNQIIFPQSPVLSGNYLNFIIGGNPGTGKTELAKKFPHLLYRLGLTPTPPNDSLIRITTRNDWIAEYEGQTAPRTRMGLLRGLGSLIIMDEFYSFVLNDKDAYGYEFINQLVNDMTEYRGLLCVMVMGYYDKIEQNIMKTNEGLNRRFSIKWKIENYTPSELFLILFYKLIDDGYILPGGITQLNSEKKRQMNMLVESLQNKIPLKKTKEFQITAEEYDNYDSVFNITTQLHQRGLFLTTNAAVVPVLIGGYQGLIVSDLVVNSKTGAFEKNYANLKKSNLKNLNLPKFISSLIIFAMQKGVTIIKV